MIRINPITKWRRRAFNITTVTAIAGAMCIGAAATPAMAATPQAYFQTPWHKQGVNVQSFKLSSKTFQQCYELASANVASSDKQLGETRIVGYGLTPGVYKVTSYSQPNCANGYGTAGSTGYVNTKLNNFWTLYTGHAPTRVR
ncbi:hypothetical protein [Curtobacterium flaccumfaciens]|uniref:hypothetical protein n=1 Tax=Curtobacterium flaccumfaciens TaxID=2035 RepID=UPI001BDF50AC|nr:hypothetical protein [Curtobacterium flaccumfaciens]MBT1683812.1 hypothetical protein [Curtobacterium flaccumfaciens pv. flaccumfaciens]